MSQEEVYKILIERGGVATTGEIAGILAARFPDLGIHVYVRRTLKRMEKQGYVKRGASDTWEIIRESRPSWAVDIEESKQPPAASQRLPLG